MIFKCRLCSSLFVFFSWWSQMKSLILFFFPGRNTVVEAAAARSLVPLIERFLNAFTRGWLRFGCRQIAAESYQWEMSYIVSADLLRECFLVCFLIAVIERVLFLYLSNILKKYISKKCNDLIIFVIVSTQIYESKLRILTYVFHPFLLSLINESPNWWNSITILNQIILLYL